MGINGAGRVDNGRPFDWGRASADYARWRDIYPPDFYARMQALGLCTAGQRVLDVGTGTGVLPRALAGGGARFTGADPSAEQIAEARRLTEEQGLEIAYHVASAEALALPDEGFNIITACQCFWYFNPAVAVPNLRRMLAPGGRLAILYMNWVPAESPVAAGTEAMVLRHNPAWTGAGYTRRLPETPAWAQGLFHTEALESFDVEVPFTREGWNGRIRSCRGIGASLPAERVAAFEAEHLAYLQGFQEPLGILHHATMTVLRKA